MAITKTALAGFRAFLAPLWASLALIFSPNELRHAFASALTASTALGFAVAFLTTVGTDASANTSAGIAGSVVSFALLRIAGRLKRVEASTPSAPVAPAVPQPLVSAVEMTAEHRDELKRQIEKEYGGWGMSHVLPWNQKIDLSKIKITVPAPDEATVRLALEGSPRLWTPEEINTAINAALNPKVEPAE